MRRSTKYARVPNVVQLLQDRKNNPIIEGVLKTKLQFNPFIHSIELERDLEGHNGCVNCLEWSEDGRLLASASDDYHIMIWDPFRMKRIHDIETQHRGNIFSVKFLPRTNNTTLATGAADSKIFVFDINRSETPTMKCNCHTERVKRLATAPDTPFLFWSASEDGHVFQYDLRQRHHCRSNDKIMLINLKQHTGRFSETKCIAVNPQRTEQLAVGAHDCYARIYDRRMINLTEVAMYSNEDNEQSSNGDETVVIDNLPRGCVQYFCPGHLATQKPNMTHRAATYITFSPDGSELLVNLGSEQIYLFDINHPKDPNFLNLPTRQQVSAGGDEDTVMSESPKRSMPEEAEKLKKLGNDHLENENYLQAIFQYTLAIQKAPDCPVLYLNRATALMRRKWYGDFYDALQDCHTALHLDPGYIKAHFRLARALLELNRVDEANECLEELKERFPSYAKNHGVMMLKKDINSAVEQQQKNQKEERPLRDELSLNELYWRQQAKDYKDRFVGHCNSKTDIKEANFIGNDGNYIIAGSDDGNFFIWERPTNMITEVFQADKAIVNCVQPHPHFCLLATSGIDHEVRLWSPQPMDAESTNHKISHKAEYIDVTVNENQQRMQSDPFEMANGAVCRTS